MTNPLTKKLGHLPIWEWGLVVGAGVAAILIVRKFGPSILGAKQQPTQVQPLYSPMSGANTTVDVNYMPAGLPALSNSAPSLVNAPVVYLQGQKGSPAQQQNAGRGGGGSAGGSVGLVPPLETGLQFLTGSTGPTGSWFNPNAPGSGPASVTLLPTQAASPQEQAYLQAISGWSAAQLSNFDQQYGTTAQTYFNAHGSLPPPP